MNLKHQDNGNKEDTQNQEMFEITKMHNEERRLEKLEIYWMHPSDLPNEFVNDVRRDIRKDSED